MNPTKISYVDVSWNPVTGCTDELPCWSYCWARRMATRLRGRAGYPADDPFRPTFHPDRLGEPARHKKPKRIAVSFMGDIFNAEVPREWRYEVMRAVKGALQHTYLFLTKRPELAAKEIDWREYPNLWIGTSVDDQATADERIPHLFRCRAANRWLSIEPMRGSVDVRKLCSGWVLDHPENYIDWVVLGGGPFPMEADSVRSVRNQCQAAGVPFFFKQWGDWVPFATRATYDDGTVLGGDCGGPCGMQPLPNGRWSVHFRTGQIKTAVVAEPEDHRWGRDNALHCTYCRVGKKLAGRLLDGREWNEIPGTED